MSLHPAGSIPRLAFTGASLVVALVLALPAQAQPEGRGRNRDRGQGAGSFDVEKAVGAAVGTVLGSAVFGNDERRIIAEYFQRHDQGYDRLPPGIAKNMARGKPLPPGIAKRTLPNDLLARLPQRVGHDRVMVGADILLVEVATGVITDVLRDVLRRR
jgi:hypothetical protein